MLITQAALSAARSTFSQAAGPLVSKAHTAQHMLKQALQNQAPRELYYQS
jgi:hypothetical protein